MRRRQEDKKTRRQEDKKTRRQDDYENNVILNEVKDLTADQCAINVE